MGVVLSYLRPCVGKLGEASVQAQPDEAYVNLALP